jgi:hypothetical protein
MIIVIHPAIVMDASMSNGRLASKGSGARWALGTAHVAGHRGALEGPGEQERLRETRLASLKWLK